MFEGDTFSEKLLTCPICQCVYTDPTSLQCGHTYCRKCLTNYLKSRPDSIRKKEIPCSMRCNGTRVPDPLRPVETWASQIKPILMIKNLMEEYRQMTGTGCSACRDQTSPVKWCPMCRQSLCETCTASHRRDQTTRLHTLTDIPDRVDEPKQRYAQCENHRGTLVNLICEDCNKAICIKCWSTTHLQCSSVVPMETKLEHMQSHLLGQRSKLDSIIDNHRLSKAKFQSRVEELSRIKSNSQAQIQHIFQDIYDWVQSKETTLLIQVENAIEKENENIQRHIQFKNHALQMYQQRFNSIDKVMKSGSMTDMYNMYQSCLSSEASGGDTDSMQSVQRSLTIVMSDLRSYQLQAKIYKQRFETLDVKYSKSITVERLPDFTEFKHFDDGIGTSLRDLTILTVNRIQIIVVTDFKNNSIKSFCTVMYRPCHRRLKLDSSPWGLTHLKENLVMVTVPDLQQILTVEVNPDIVLVSTITTKKWYRSLAVLGSLGSSYLAAGSWSSACVDILNMDGEVMKSVSKHNGEELFTSPYYMCVSNKGNLLVSDCGKKSVTCLTSDGDVVWIYAPTGEKALRNPAGIQCTKEGVLLVDYYTHKVIQLTESGMLVRDLLTSKDGLRFPWGLCLNGDNVLFVCVDTLVKAFKLAVL